MQWSRAAWKLLSDLISSLKISNALRHASSGFRVPLLTQEFFSLVDEAAEFSGAGRFLGGAAHSYRLGLLCMTDWHKKQNQQKGKRMHSVKTMMDKDYHSTPISDPSLS